MKYLFLKKLGYSGFLFCLILVFITTNGFSDDLKGNEHYIIKQEKGKVYVDYGTKNGVFEGEKYRVYKIVIIRHPVTRKLLKSKVKIAASVKILSSSEEVSIIHLQAENINIGSPILLEKISDEKGLIHYSISRSNEITLQGRYVNYDRNDYYHQEELGYSYHFFNKPYNIKTGIGGINGISYKDNPDDKIDIAFYYGYVEAELQVKIFSFIENIKIGPTKEGVKVGNSGTLRVGEEFKTHLLIGYSFYPIYGTNGFLEFNLTATKSIFPMLAVIVEKIPEEVISSTLFLAGINFQISEDTYLKPVLGFGGRSTTRMGFNLSLNTKFNF